MENYDEKRCIDGITPIQICGDAISRLSDIWDEITDRTGQGKGEFIDKFFGEIFRDGNTGEEFEAELERWEEQPEDMQPFGLIQAMLICTAYSCQGMKAQKDERMGMAWGYTSKCQYWLGLVVGAWSIRRDDIPFAIKGATARHAENRAIKRDVFDWLDEHFQAHKSMDAAAEVIAGNIAPVKFRTARDWVGQWKKLRSTGTP